MGQCYYTVSKNGKGVCAGKLTVVDVPPDLVPVGSIDWRLVYLPFD